MVKISENIYQNNKGWTLPKDLYQKVTLEQKSPVRVTPSRQSISNNFIRIPYWNASVISKGTMIWSRMQLKSPTSQSMEYSLFFMSKVLVYIMLGYTNSRTTIEKKVSSVRRRDKEVHNFKKIGEKYFFSLEVPRSRELRWNSGPEEGSRWHGNFETGSPRYRRHVFGVLISTEVECTVVNRI